MGGDVGNEGGERSEADLEVGIASPVIAEPRRQIKTCQSNAISVRNLIVTLIKIASGEEPSARAEVRGRRGEMRVCWAVVGQGSRVPCALDFCRWSSAVARCCTMSNNRQCI